MSKVLDKLADGFRTATGAVGGALKKVDSDLPRSDATSDFRGKGLLTALFDTTGSEIKRRRALEDGMKMSMVKPLLEKYWLGNLEEDERDAVSAEIKRILGGGPHVKQFLDNMFSVGGQMHRLNGVINPPPSQVDSALQGAGAALDQDNQGGEAAAEGGTQTSTEPEMRMDSEAGMMPVMPSGLTAPPSMAQPPAQATRSMPPPPSMNLGSAAPQNVTVSTTPPTPLQSALGKMYPPEPAKMSKADELAAQQSNAIALADRNSSNRRAENKEQAGFRMDELQAQIDAGKFNKPVKFETKPEVIDGVTRNVTKVYDAITGEVLHSYVSDNAAGAAPRSGAPGADRRKGFIIRDGKPMSALFDKTTNQLIPGSENPDEMPPASILPRLSEREAIVFNPEDNSFVTIPLQSSRGVDLSRVGGSGAGVSGGAGAGTTPAGQGPAPGGRSGVGVAPTHVGGRDLGGVVPAGSVNQMQQRQIPITEAYAQLAGTREFPNSGFSQYATIADDKERSAKLARAIELTFSDIRQDEKSHGSLINLLKLYAGIPAEEIRSRIATYEQVIGKELEGDPELKRAYNATMAVFATAVGLRSLTRAGASQASVERIENEIPIIGKNAHSSQDVYDMLARLMREVYNGAKNTPTIGKDELKFIENQVHELERLSKTPPKGKGGLNPPPSAGGIKAPSPSGNTGGVTIRKVK